MISRNSLSSFYTLRLCRLMLIATTTLLLSACQSGAYNQSLLGQVNELKQEMQRLQEENRVLSMKLQEIQVRYGIRLDQIQLEQRPPNSIFKRVFSDTESTQ